MPQLQTVPSSDNPDRRPFYSLRSRLLAVVLLLIAPIFGLILLSTTELQQFETAEAEMTAFRFARLAASTQGQQIAAARQLLTAIAQLPAVQNRDSETCNPFFENLLREHPEYSNISVAALDGETFFCSAIPPNPGVNISDRAWFQRTLEARDFAVGDYIVARTTNAPSISFGYPVSDPDGELIGIAVVSTHLNWLSTWLGQIDLPPNSTLRVLDANGVVLANYPYEENLIGVPLRTNGLFAVIESEREGTAEATGGDGEARFYGFTTLGDMAGDIHVIVGISKAVALAQANRLQILLIVIILGGTAALLTVGWLGASRLIIQPIRGLIDATERLAKGDLTTRTQLPKGIRELDRLAYSIDYLGESLVRREAELRESALQLAAETDARRAAEQADELKLRFLAMISHELRTPLTSIKGFSSTLLAEDVQFDPQEQRQFIQVIDEESNKLVELVNQLLDVSRLQAGTLKIQPEPCMLTDIVKVASAQIHSVTQNHHLSIHIPDTVPPVIADPQRMAQVLVNLISNSAKYSSVGTSITVAAKRENGNVQVDVADEGVGIPESERNTVFEAFHQVDRKQGIRAGAGLGLAICKGLVESHGGRIWVQDDVPAGTVISFTLPVAEE